MSDMEKWYLLRCKPRSDNQAAAFLEEQGYPSYSPHIWVKKAKKAKRKSIQEPLFPGYIFIKLDPNRANWRAIRSTRSVIDIVKFGDYIPVVHESIVEKIAEQVESICVDCEKPETYSKGEVVQAPGSCFDGFKLIYQCSLGRDRVKVLIDVVGRMSEVSIKQSDLRKCPSH